MTGPKELIEKLHKNQELSLEEWTELIKNRTPELSEYLFELAREERHKYYGHDVYVRGLIEFTNYCRNDCLYCGIRKRMQQHTGIVWTRIPFFAAARKAMILVSAHLSCKVEKMDILQKRGLSTLSDESENIFHNVQSLFPLENGKKTVIRHSLMLAQTVISCAMRLIILNTTLSSTRQS